MTGFPLNDMALPVGVIILSGMATVTVLKGTL